MHNLLLDACIWLDLAKSEEYEPIVAHLLALGGDKKIRIILPKLVRDEFDRNAPDLAKRESKQATSHIKGVRATVKRVVPAAQQSQFAEALDALEQHITAHGTNLSKSTEVIRELMGKDFVKTIQDNTSHRLQAFERGLQKKAPFRHKNSCADALILELFSEWVRSHSSETSIFVTSNTSDFSSPINNQKPHDDIAALFNESDHLFFINIGSAINHVQDNAISAEVVEKFEPHSSTSCPHCGSDTGTMMLQSAYGGWTLHYICRQCAWRLDSEELMGGRVYNEG